MSTVWLVSVYLVALVAANLLVLNFGQRALVVTALFLIPYDFAIRVRLQEFWRDRPVQLWLRLFALMVAGGGLTWLLAPASLRIAVSGVTAFACSSLVGAVVYELRCWDEQGAEHWPARVWSLLAMALVDTCLFTWMAFDVYSVPLMVGQVGLKAAMAYGILKGRFV